MKATPTYVMSSATEVASTNGYGFRGWRYATADAQLTHNETTRPVCLDTGYIMTLVDQLFLKEQAPNTMIQQMPSPIAVRGLCSNTHESNESIYTS